MIGPKICALKYCLLFSTLPRFIVTFSRELDFFVLFFSFKTSLEAILGAKTGSLGLIVIDERY